ncbi:sensor domain-containing diguanylate cyclase [Xylophilus sp. GW821-FHT01B05]
MLSPPDLLHALPSAVMVISEGLIVYVNAACVAVLEADGPESLLGRPPEAFIHPLDQARAALRLSRLGSDATPNAPAHLRIQTCRGASRVLLLTSAAARHAGKDTIVVNGLDMTGHSQTEQQLRASERSYREMFENMQDVYYRTDAEGVVTNVGPAVRRVLGHDPQEIIGRKAEAWYPNTADRDAFTHAIQVYGEVTDFPGQMVRKDGRVIDISISSRALRDAAGAFAGVEGLWRDVTQRKNLERELQHMARTDMLTGIANRRSFLEQAEARLLRFRQGGGWFALLVLDLDHFKAINDRYGHQEGDRALVRFTETVEAHIGAGDLLGRLGGEEFGLLLARPTAEAATEVAEQLVRRVAQLQLPPHDGEARTLTASIGMTGVRATDAQLSDLLERADRALYQAKRSGRNQLVCAD